jgi:hypothetical protein
MPGNLSNYQLDLTTPGISPREAIFLKQIRHMPNFLRNARLLPQMGHLLYARVVNFCFLIAFAISDFLAKASSLDLASERHP